MRFPRYLPHFKLSLTRRLLYSCFQACLYLNWQPGPFHQRYYKLKTSSGISRKGVCQFCFRPKPFYSLFNSDHHILQCLEWTLSVLRSGKLDLPKEAIPVRRFYHLNAGILRLRLPRADRQDISQPLGNQPSMSQQLVVATTMY